VNVSKSRPVTMLQARPHAIHFKPILDFGEGQCRTYMPNMLCAVAYSLCLSRPISDRHAKSNTDDGIAVNKPRSLALFNEQTGERYPSAQAMRRFTDRQRET